MPSRSVVYAIGIINGIWYNYNTPNSGPGAILLELVRPTVPTINLVPHSVGFSVELKGLSDNVFDRTSLPAKVLGGAYMPSDFLTRSHSTVRSTFQQSQVNVTPTSVVVTVLDNANNVLQTSDNTTLTTVSTGIVEFTVLPTTFVAAGCYLVRWLVIMPDTTQLQFDIPVTVDSEVR